MFNKEYVRAQKDHAHFTNKCCLCKKIKDDSKMLAVWINRISGLVPKSYLEPDYICTKCDEKHTKEVEALNGQD